MRSHIPGKRERVPLEVGNLGARDEDVLARAGRRLLLLDLQLHDVGRVLDDLVNVGPVTGADFAKDTLEDPDDTTDEPVTLHTKFTSVRTFMYLCMGAVRTQKTPMVLYEQYGGRSGLIMQNMPCSCQLMKKTMKRW